MQINLLWNLLSLGEGEYCLSKDVDVSKRTACLEAIARAYTLLQLERISNCKIRWS